MPDNVDKDAQVVPNEQEIKNNAKEAGEINNGLHNNPVKEALKKEKQPITPEDLSSLHNTHEVGTSGGDQRAPDNKNSDTGSGPNLSENTTKPIPVEEPGTRNAPSIKYEEPATEHFEKNNNDE